MSASIVLDTPASGPASGWRAESWSPPQAIGLTHSVAESFEDIAALQPEWDALAAAVGADVFSSFDWCRVWWRHYGHGRQLHIHLFRDGERLVGFLPLFAETLGIGPFSISAVRLVGCDHSVSTCGPALLAEYTPRIFSRLISHPNLRAADVVVLGPLAGYSENGRGWAAALEEVGQYNVRLEPAGPQMVFDIPATYEEFLDNLPKKRRYEFRNEEKRWEQAGKLSCDVRSEKQDALAAFDEFMPLHQRYWEAQGQLGHFGDWPSSIRFHKESVNAQAEKNRIVFCEYHLDGELITSEYSYQFGPRVHWFLTARRPDVGGRLGFAGLVRECCRRGVRQIDGMCGYYDYKKWMGARVVQQTRVVAVKKELPSRLRASAFERSARALDLFYYRLWFSRVAPRIPWRGRKPLRQSWIRSRI